MTERLYYLDSYLREFPARIVDASADACTVYLDRTAFYPTSGGQPFDTGTIGGIRVVEVVDEDERIAHRLAGPAAAGDVQCAVDWARRFDHMQQHTGQHLLSAVFDEMFGLMTVSFHLGAQTATIDLECDLEGTPLDSQTAAEAERRANEIVVENRPVTVRFEEAAAARGLRKASTRTGTLRIVSIDSLDRSACGGTHVRATGEIGAILLRKLEKVRQATRVEFLCGARAVQRARNDFEAISKAAQHFSAPVDEVPSAIAALLESERAGEKLRRKLELDLAGYRGKELYDSTAPGPGGIRRATRRLDRGALDDLRAIAQSFTAHPNAVFTGTLAEPPSILLATSADSGVDAGKLLKGALAEAGGRGGGSARIAQGSVPDAALLDQVLSRL